MEKISRRRVIVFGCFLIALWSLSQNADLLNTLRYFLQKDHPWGLLRLVGSLLPTALILPALFLSAEKRKLVLWPLAAVSLMMLLGAAFGGRDPDETVHLRMAWMMGEGLVPYRDFFTVRNLLWHAMCIPLVKVFDASMTIIYAARILMTIISISFLAMLVPLARRSGGHPVAALLPLLFPLFAWGAVEFRADPPMTLLLLGSLIALGRKSPLVAGVLSGIAFLMLQKAAFHGLAMGAGILLSGMGWRCFFRYSAAATLVSSLHAVWAVGLGIWTDYWVCTVESSGVFASYHQATPFLDSMVVLVFGIEFRANPLLFLLAAGGVFLWWRSGEAFSKLLAVCLVTDLALVCLGKLAFKNYLLFPLALLALAAARSFQEMETSSANSDSKLEAALPTATLLLLFSIGFVRFSAEPPTRIDISEASALLQALPPDEVYYTDSHRGNLVSPIYRKNPTYYAHSASRFSYWFKTAGKVPPKSEPCSIDLLLEKPPGAFVMNADKEEYMARAKSELGIEYTEVAPELYLRSDLDASAFEIVRPTQPEE